MVITIPQTTIEGILEEFGNPKKHGVRARELESLPQCYPHEWRNFGKISLHLENAISLLMFLVFV